jgi:hypothetical protein
MATDKLENQLKESVVRVIDLVPGRVCELPCVDASSLDQHTFWTHYVRKHRPILVKGGVKDWPAVARWCAPGYLESLCADEQAGMLKTFNPSVLFNEMFRSGKVVDHLVEMRKASDDLTYSIPALGIPAKWASDLGTYSFLARELDKPPRMYQRRRLFVYRNASTEWHYHATDETLTTQLVGSKRFSIFHLSNDEWEAYSEPLKHNCHHLSCGKQFFPQAGTLIKYEGCLQVGDALYIPPFWWHGIDPLDSSFGITLAHCFRTPLPRLGDWKMEPAARDVIRGMPRGRKQAAFSLLALSSLTRFVARETW